MTSKLYSRVSNFEDIDTLTRNTEAPFGRSRVTFSSGTLKTHRRCVFLSLTIVALVLVLILALGIGIPYALAKNEGRNGRGECQLDPEERFDCLPGISTVDQTSCSQHGCCWEEKTGSPSCFYSLKSGYSVSGNVQDTAMGSQVDLIKESSPQSSPYGPDITKIHAEFRQEANTRLRVRVCSTHK